MIRGNTASNKEYLKNFPISNSSKYFSSQLNSHKTYLIHYVYGLSCLLFFYLGFVIVSYEIIGLAFFSKMGQMICEYKKGIA